MMGGMVIGMGLLQIDWLRYIRQARDADFAGYYYRSDQKCELFAIIIALVGDARGFQVERAALKVGDHIISGEINFFMIIVADLIVTTFSSIFCNCGI